MEQEIIIALRYELAIGEVSLDEIVFRLKELRDSLMLRILERILVSYDDLICERLGRTDLYPSKARKGLGRHFQKDDQAEHSCRGRKIRKRGYRSHPRVVSTVFGQLRLPIRVVECCRCGAFYSPLLSALGIGRYDRHESNFEQEVIEAVIDTNYRRLIKGRSIDISVGGIHNLVVGSDLDRVYQTPVAPATLSGIIADGTGLKQYRGEKGELRAVIGVTTSGRVEPLGTFTNTDWSDIEKNIKKRLEKTESPIPPFIYDGEPGLDSFLADITQSQRCTWHGPRGLYHALWEDGLKKKDSQPEIDRMKHLIGIELPKGDYEILKEEDKEAVNSRYQASKAQVQELIETFRQKGYTHGVTYLEKISKRLFTHIEIWLQSGVITPKTTSLLERVFREIGRRLKRIAWGWSDPVATKLSKMILLKQYSHKDWEKYWMNKLHIVGHFQIEIASVY